MPLYPPHFALTVVAACTPQGYDRPALRVSDLEPVICEWLGRGSTGEVFSVVDPDGEALALCERWRSAPTPAAWRAPAPAAAAAVDVKAEGAVPAAAEAKAAPAAAASAAASGSSDGVVPRRSRRLAKLKECRNRVAGTPDRPRRPAAAAAATGGASAGELALAGAADGLRSWYGVAKWYRRLGGGGGSDLRRAFEREVDAYRVLNAAHCEGVLFCVAAEYPYVLLDGLGDPVTKLVIADVKPLLRTLETMHKCGVLHLDLRYSNLLRRGDSITVIDFTCSVRAPVCRVDCHVLSPLTLHLLGPSIRYRPKRQVMAVAHRPVHRTRNSPRASSAKTSCRRPRTI
jgi:hypothetical protein